MLRLLSTKIRGGATGNDEAAINSGSDEAAIAAINSGVNRGAATGRRGKVMLRMLQATQQGQHLPQRSSLWITRALRQS